MTATDTGEIGMRGWWLAHAWHAAEYDFRYTFRAANGKIGENWGQYIFFPKTKRAKGAA